MHGQFEQIGAIIDEVTAESVWGYDRSPSSFVRSFVRSQFDCRCSGVLHWRLLRRTAADRSLFCASDGVFSSSLAPVVAEI